MEVIREKQYARIIEGLENEEISSGRGLNQETSLKRYGDTRWGSHYVTIVRLLTMFSSVLDELDDRSTEMSTELLICVACLNPSDSLSIFNKEKLICLALFYRSEFSIVDLIVLDDQLDTYIIDLHGDDEFFGIECIASIVEKMVKTKKNLIFPLVYMLIKLSLLLPVETATVERVFYVMHTIKSRLRKRMGDKWMNDSLVVYIEKDIFDKIDNEAIIKRFQNIKTRRKQL
ncbi:hypothetical protein NC651_001114 [Populus alba x Populus x berolinensis]|nr:hypothetical protein NC651_001114 [Populus alba x Populus x berolinensis]